MQHRGRPMTEEEKQNCRISRRHPCPVCGRIHYIGRDEERNAWECITETSQCRYCGGLITITAREDRKA